MTETMVDRVAKALEPKCVAFGPGNTPHLVALEFARAAIAAMREPTPQMMDAFYKAWAGRVRPEGMDINLPAYTAMIDQALAEDGE